MAGQPPVDGNTRGLELLSATILSDTPQLDFTGVAFDGGVSGRIPFQHISDMHGQIKYEFNGC